jgi:hypothetical protein
VLDIYCCSRRVVVGFEETKRVQCFAILRVRGDASAKKKKQEKLFKNMPPFRHKSSHSFHLERLQTYDTLVAAEFVARWYYCGAHLAVVYK